MTAPSKQGDILWQPTPEQAQATRMAAYIRYLSETKSLSFPNYEAMWHWSIDDLETFWASIWEFFDIQAASKPTAILSNPVMPNAKWFSGSTLNYTDQILRFADELGPEPALVSHSETFGDQTLTWDDLRAQVASVAHHLREMGVEQGDRVAAILPNTPPSIIAFLATASIGAVWSLCAPDMGHIAVLDRFRQIAPKVLITQDGYTLAGAKIDRSAIIDEVRENLPSVTHHITIPVARTLPKQATDWNDLTHTRAPYAGTPVPFDHPLWIVYSSGTTGNPKPIVHGHGGIVIEAAKQALHQDLHKGDRFCWLTSSGWIMWNAQFTALGQGATVAMFDAAPNHPDLRSLWQFAADQNLTYLGAGAAFFTSCMKAGITLDDLSFPQLRAIGATGSPLTSDGYDWVYNTVKSNVWLAPISGGTDLSGAFVCGNPMLPVRAGEMQCRSLGNATFAFDPAGHPLTGEVGELVCTKPLPSMPLYFWGDDTGERLHDSYFDTYPNIWRHGDWIEITQQGGAIIYGRSDATINRRGLRLGSSEIYQAVESLSEIQDSLVIDLEFLGRESFMVLFVVPSEGTALDDTLKAAINQAIKTAVSPRFQPSEIVEIAAVPRTLSGKKLEVPVKKLLLGGDPKTVVNRDSMANPDSFDQFIAYHASRQTKAQS